MTIRPLTTSLAVLMLLTMLAGCGSSDSDGTDSDGSDSNGSTDEAYRNEPAPLAREPVPELDVAGSQADTAAGEIDATLAQDHTYVGAVTEALYISISLEEDADAAQSQPALVYLCDGQYAEYLVGEIGPEMTTLTGQVMDVELSIADGVVAGAVISDDADPWPFTAEAASGDAGLYAASFDYDGVDYRPVWIVLADGSQRGGACWRCCSGAHCDICCPAAADTAGPTVDWNDYTYWWEWLWFL